MTFSVDKDNSQPGAKPRQLIPRRYLIMLLSLVFIAVTVMTIFRPSQTTEATAPTQPMPAAAKAVQIQASGTIPGNIGQLASTPSIWPAKGSVTSGFGWRVSPLGDGSELHEGLDIANPLGAPVVATADGKVVLSGPYGGYGNAVEIDHGNSLSTVYGHNSQLAVEAGQQVKKGQVIAYVGSTGKSTGPHIHYEVRVNSTAVDPWKYLIAF